MKPLSFGRTSVASLTKAKNSKFFGQRMSLQSLSNNVLVVGQTTKHSMNSKKIRLQSSH